MLRCYTHLNGQLVEAPDPSSGDQPPNIVWFDLLNPSREEELQVETNLSLEVPTRAEMAEIELSARLYHEDGAQFMTMTALSRLDADEPLKTPVTFILKGQTLVTVRYADSKPFLQFGMRAQRPNAAIYTSGEQVMMGLIEAMIDRIADALEKVGDEIDAISRAVFRTQGTRAMKSHDLQAAIEQIGRKGDLLTMIQEALVSLARVVAYHSVPDGVQGKAAKETRQRGRQIQRDATSLREHASFLSSKVTFLLDATLGLINLEQNQIIKIFSVAAVVFLPPTLVASIYGMNFAIMPELHLPFGYPMALGLMVLSAILPFAYFKRRGWL
ncbi:MAG TPA: magnesium transporter CorA family protein [Devosia sp.]|nr:magnesium transporter CorA family protein [Devosia sp.]